MALRSQNSRMQLWRSKRFQCLRRVTDFLFAEVFASPSLIIHSTTTIVLSGAALSVLAAARIAFGKKVRLSGNHELEARENFLAESL